MQRTLLLGTPVIKAATACNILKSSSAAGRKAFPAASWLAVMHAGLEGCTVAWLDQRKVCLKTLPSDRAAKVEYHNALMQLCGLSLRDLVAAMREKKAKADHKTHNTAAPADGVAAGE
eukprot:7027837-Karenia_brevis.AAC.1